MLDIKRSTVDLGHLFVLTTTRVFWLKVIPASEDGLNMESGVEVLLSHQHYRTATDETMKLTMSKDKDGTGLTVFITSNENSRLNSYTFFMDGNIARSFEGAFRLSPGISEKVVFRAETLSITPAPYLIRRESTQGAGLDFMKAGVKFYQAWLLTSNFELVSSLWASEIINSQQKWISRSNLTAPTKKFADNSIRITASRLADDFIVPDDDDDDDDDVLVDKMGSLMTQNHGLSFKVNKVSLDLNLRINMRPVFERIFNEKISNGSTSDMEMAFRDISIHMQNNKQGDSMSLKTCLELSDNACPSAILMRQRKL
ncbi:hypothetical protein DID88_003257 [Monilinia fructigena]|uniref:RRN6 beta-propeller domain-containing protein n=1 Tax=Monilinia fructigena TaxID=38457 RepID=A0A395J0D9_9HELO|nr:hypothetical protein DID88_003257 [Monilinia fructigena]